MCRCWKASDKVYNVTCTIKRACQQQSFTTGPISARVQSEWPARRPLEWRAASSLVLGLMEDSVYVISCATAQDRVIHGRLLSAEHLRSDVARQSVKHWLRCDVVLSPWQLKRDQVQLECLSNGATSGTPTVSATPPQLIAPPQSAAQPNSQALTTARGPEAPVPPPSLPSRLQSQLRPLLRLKVCAAASRSCV